MSPAATEEKGYDEAYLAFARTLRTWFVAYGIGVPALVVSQDKLIDRVMKSGAGIWLARLFLGGVAVQILTAIIYKAAMWHLYRAEYDENAKEKLTYPFFNWLSDAFWLEMMLDILTAALFVFGTIKTLNILSSPPRG